MATASEHTRSERTGSRLRLRLALAGALVAVPAGLLVTPATATQTAAEPSAVPSGVSVLPPPPPDVMRSAEPGCGGLDQLGELDGRPICSHGTDPRRGGPRTARLGAVPAGHFTGCYGDGRSGFRVQAIYARAADKPDRYAEVAASIPGWAAAVDEVFAASAAETGGDRHVRWVTQGEGAACALDVDNVVLPAGSDSADFAATIDALVRSGRTSATRKYLLWMDAEELCGVATAVEDDSAMLSNDSVGTGWARVDRGCWGRDDPSVEAHELMHTLGSVNPSAPHSTPAGHCTDAAEVMCYADAPGVRLTNSCPTTHQNRFDCNADDYYSTAPPPGSYLATHWNTAGSPYLTDLPPGSAEPSGDGQYHPVQPSRALDSRLATDAEPALGRLAPGARYAIRLAGADGVPETGVSAVVVNVTVTGPTASGHLTVYPYGSPRPVAANLNYVAGQTVANAVVASLGSYGAISLSSAAGSPHVVIDVVGWFADRTGTWPSADGYGPLPPQRMFDTRTGEGAGGVVKPLGSASTLTAQVAGRQGVPADATAVILNVVATNTTRSGHLTVWPTGRARPGTASLSTRRGFSVPNLVVAPVGAGGRISMFNAVGATDVVADVIGYFAPARGGGPSGTYHAAVPRRILDTREGRGGPVLVAGTTRQLVVSPAGPVPAGVSAVVMNTAVVAPTISGHLTVYPSGPARPDTSSLNFARGQTVANLVIVPVGNAGQVSIDLVVGRAHVVGDVTGWFDLG